MKYQLLETEITQNGGHHYKQIWRDDHVAVYEQYGASGKLYGYEVIVIQKLPAGRVFSRSYPARESYPCSEDWGSFGWTKNNREEAMERAFDVSARCEKGEFEGRFHKAR